MTEKIEGLDGILGVEDKETPEPKTEPKPEQETEEKAVEVVKPEKKKKGGRKCAI